MTPRRWAPTPARPSRARVASLRVDCSAQDQQRQVGIGRDDSRVADAHDRRRIDDDLVVFFGQHFQEFAKHRAIEHFRRISRLGSAGEKIRPSIGALNCSLPCALPAQQAGKADAVVLEIEDDVLGRISQIGVDQQNLLSRLGDDRGQIGRRGALAVSGGWRGDEQGLAAIFGAPK